MLSKMRHAYCFCFLLIASCASLPAPLSYTQRVPSKSTRMVLVGDTQRTLWLEFWREQNDWLREKLFSQIVKEEPDAILLLGDMVSWGASEKQWAYFDSIASPVRRASIPLFALMGNHEYMGSNAAAAEHINIRFPLLAARTWYSFVSDSLAVVVLNSNIGELNTAQRNEQKRWLDSTLRAYDASPAVLAILCCWHHPAYTNSTVVEDDPSVHEDFLPTVCASPKVQLIASGHAHTYEHFVNHGKDFLVSGGGGGPRQELHPATDSLHRDLYKATPSNARTRDFHYCIVERKGTALSLTMIRFDIPSASWQKADEWITGRTGHPLK